VSRVVTLSEAVKAVNRRGVLLVFPAANQADPPSLWSELHPRSRMRWEWNDDGDDRVGELWHLRARLARSGKVIYSKWYRGRATLISRPVFRAMLRAAHDRGDPVSGLRPESRQLLDLLEENSPQSTRSLRSEANLEGKPLEAIYARGLKELWARLLIVGAGEVDDGAFPSLAIGATKLLFEDLWAARDAPNAEDARLLDSALAGSPAFTRFFNQLRAQPRGA
jgi:hypothetical protein